MSEQFRGVEEFVAAVEAGSFAQAAQRLHITRSAVAKSIAVMESRLGVRLFHRTTRSQSLTDEGAACYERCRRALQELEAARQDIDAGRLVPTGRVRVSMPDVVGRLCVVPLLLELAQQHPELVLEVSLNDRRVDLVEDGVDVALRSGALPDSAVLSARSVGHQWMGVYAAPAYLAARGRPADLAGLRAQFPAHGFIVYGRAGASGRWRFGQGERPEDTLPIPAPALVFDSIEAMCAAAVAGLGLVRLPKWLVAPAVASGQLLPVFDEPVPFGFPMHLLWPHSRRLPLKTRVVLDLLGQRLPGLLAAS
jgi:DNA-binding transcriptional LysR family regulator